MNNTNRSFYIKKSQICICAVVAFLLQLDISLYAQRYSPLSAPQTGYITDLILIYQGGTHRPDWTRDRFIPYIYKKTGGKGLAFLFDAFLFIEYKDNLGSQFADGYSIKPAGKKQWKWLLGRNFEKGKAIDALNGVLDSLDRRGIKPKRKRKVILTLPEPILGQRNWGEVTGRQLDFNRAADRIAASKWFIDEAISSWEEGNFNQLNLAGFYWVSEQSATSKSILPEIAAYIKSKKLKFYWIPYWKSKGSTEWKQIGFDAAYQQPNHFFKENVPDSRIDSACAVAKRLGMGLEFEFDMRVEQPSFERRFLAYLNRFKEYKVQDQASIAYYEGGDGIYRLATHSKPEKRRLYAILCDFIIKRQLKADKMYQSRVKK